MNEERDKFLTEAMGEEWHEVLTINDKYVTCICGKKSFMNPCPSNSDFSTWEGFGKLLGFIQNHSKWIYLLENNPFAFQLQNANCWLYSPNKFADAVYEFLKDKKYEQ